MEQKNANFTSGPVLGALVRFAVPVLLALGLQTLYGMVDVLVIGKFGSTAGVSAVSTGSQVFTIATFLISGFTTASTVLIGQYLGAEDEKQVTRTIGASIPLFAVLSAVLTVLMVAAYPFVLQLLNVPAEAVAEAKIYTLICCVGIPLIVGYNTVGAFLRGLGDSKSPLVFVGIACGVNIVGDLLLTGFFQMGAAGVAIATVTAQGVSFLISLLHMARHGIGVPFSRSAIRFDKGITRKVISLGVPLALQSIMVNMSFLFITAIINSMGVTASAAMGVGDKITSVAFLPHMAFSQAVQVFVAQNVGAGKTSRAARGTALSIAVTSVWGAAFCLLANIQPALLPGMFSSDPAVIAMTGDYVRAYSFDVILTCAVFCLNGFLAGCGSAGFSMAVNLFNSFGVRIPVTYLMSRLPEPSLFMIGLAAPISSVLGILVTLIYLKTDRWKKGVVSAPADEKNAAAGE